MDDRLLPQRARVVGGPLSAAGMRGRAVQRHPGLSDRAAARPRRGVRPRGPAGPQRPRTVQQSRHARWEDNPYNAANGGPVAADDPAAFFTDPTARDLFKKRLRYLVARYGAYRDILAWELFNEISVRRSPTPQSLQQRAGPRRHRRLAHGDGRLPPRHRPVRPPDHDQLGHRVERRTSGATRTSTSSRSMTTAGRAAVTPVPRLRRGPQRGVRQARDHRGVRHHRAIRSRDSTRRRRPCPTTAWPTCSGHAPPQRGLGLGDVRLRGHVVVVGRLHPHNAAQNRRSGLPGSTNESTRRCATSSPARIWPAWASTLGIAAPATVVALGLDNGSQGFAWIRDAQNEYGTGAGPGDLAADDERRRRSNRRLLQRYRTASRSMTPGACSRRRLASRPAGGGTLSVPCPLHADVAIKIRPAGAATARPAGHRDHHQSERRRGHDHESPTRSAAGRLGLHVPRPQLAIAAPTAKAANPLTLVFTVDAGLLASVDPDLTAATLAVFRNGVVVSHAPPAGRRRTRASACARPSPAALTGRRPDHRPDQPGQHLERRLRANRPRPVPRPG